MAELFIIIIIVAAIMTAVIVYLSLRRQKKAVVDEVSRLQLRLKEMEMKIEAESRKSSPHPLPTKSDGGAKMCPSPDEPTLSGDAGEEVSVHHPHKEESRVNLMTDEELFCYLSKTIKDEEMFLWPDLNRKTIMDHFAVSAVRIGNAFSRGGGMGLPEFVRNCRLDYACRLMMDHPKMPFTEVGRQSGYHRTTTFYHDFKARFGMPPAEYRERKKSEK